MTTFPGHHLRAGASARLPWSVDISPETAN